MAPKPKSVPSRLGPPPQLSNYRVPIVHQKQRKFEPKMREIFSRQAKMLARWMHFNLTWKRILLTWMVLLVASKMVLLMLTYQFFSMTALISLQVFHGVWTIAFFCLSIIESKAILPNASCLLAGYLPATTVLHILLIPNNYPLEFIITDAVGTFLAIITMFLLLRMECSEILLEAEELWERQAESDTTSESGLSSTSGCSTSSTRNILLQSNFSPELAEAGGSRKIIGNPHGPTIISVNGMNPANAQARQQHLLQQQLDSMLYHSLEEPDDLVLASTASSSHPAGEEIRERANSNRGGVAVSARAGMAPNALGGSANNIFDEAVDLEPIDFEHFVDEPEMNQSERMFKVAFGSSPPTRGR